MVRRNFTFVEILVGLVITSLILGMVFTSLHETSLIHTRLMRGGEEILSRAEFQQRLDAIFSNLTPTETREYFFGFVPNERGVNELHVRFQCGIDPDPSFSDHVLGVFRLKEQGLVLQVTGKNAVTKREETIRKGVTEVQYEFLSKGDVSTIWDRRENHPPEYIKMVLCWGDCKKEEYVFWINKQPIGVEIQ